MIAYIQFKDGSIHDCTGKVKGGVPLESPGVGVPWVSEAELFKHVADNGLVLIRIKP